MKTIVFTLSMTAVIFLFKYTLIALGNTEIAWMITTLIYLVITGIIVNLTFHNE